jgi:hypothetical protein
MNPRTNGQSRVSYAVGIKLKTLPNGAEIDVKGLLGPGPHQQRVSWSPVTEKNHGLFFCSPPCPVWHRRPRGYRRGRRHRLPPVGHRPNDAFGNADWVSDSKPLWLAPCSQGSWRRAGAPPPMPCPLVPLCKLEKRWRQTAAPTYQIC